MGHTRIFGNKIGKKKESKGHNLETKKGEQSFMGLAHCLYLILIPIKFHEYIPKSYQVMGCTRMKITQNKPKNNQRAITLKQKNGKQP